MPIGPSAALLVELYRGNQRDTFRERRNLEVKRLPLVLAAFSALTIIAAVSCTEAKVPTTSSEVSLSFAALSELFSSDQPDIEARASTADDLLKDPEALAYLKQMSKDGADNERAASAFALGRSDDPIAVTELCDMVEDSNKRIRDHVYIALQRHNTAEAREGLTKAVMLHGPEDGLTEVICDVMDAKMWAATSEFIMASIGDLDVAELEFGFDADSFKVLIESARQHEFETSEFDEEELLGSLREFNNKQALVDWANEIMGMELDVSDGNRDELETMIVDFNRPEEEAGD